MTNTADRVDDAADAIIAIVTKGLRHTIEPDKQIRIDVGNAVEELINACREHYRQLYQQQ